MVAGRESVVLEVERLVAGGAGLATLDGRKVFIPFTAPGEKVRARLVTCRRDYAIAELAAVLEPSRFRREPPCPYYGRCGGCRLQHVAYEEQLRVKAGMVGDALRRIGRLDTGTEPVVPAPAEWRYRNKTQYAVGLDARRAPVVGYYRSGTHEIIPAETCPLHPPVFDSARRALAGWLCASSGEAYDERSHSGNVRHLVLRADADRAVAIVATRTRRLDPGLIACLLAVPGITAVARTHNPEPTNRIFGQRTEAVAGEPGLDYAPAGYRLRVSPGSFFQVNTDQAGNLARLVRARLADRRWARIIDLYSGVGLLALAVADLADRVVGIELEPAAVADAVHNARQAAPPAETGQGRARAGVEFRPGSADDFAFAAASAGDREAVILDPPRKGASRKLLDALAAARPARVVYVSCDPATLARDLALLVAAGYRPARVEPLDMFPQTAHVETVATLERNDA